MKQYNGGNLEAITSSMCYYQGIMAGFEKYIGDRTAEAGNGNHTGIQAE